MIPKSQIRNFRFGLATNSSSTHSIVHMPDNQVRTISEAPKFGWDFFTVSSKEEKKTYLLGQLLSNIPERDMYISILKMAGFEDSSKFLEDLYVDHQSVINIPKTPSNHNPKINIDFFMEYMDYILENDFVILGGNDNDSAEHELADQGDQKKNYFESFDGDDIAYKNGNYWLVHNKKRKLRIAFHDYLLRPAAAELVDLKITDYCDIGCNFCYMDSTVKGQHASLDDLRKIRNAVTRYNSVTEFALGGGEPTSHPEFSQILKMLYEDSNIVNFTTKSTTWFNNKVIVDTVKEYVSGVAYSVTAVADLSKFANLHYEHFKIEIDESNVVQMYIHLIPEILGNDLFREILDEIEQLNKKLDEYNYYDNRIKVTLLGLKPIGRASEADKKIIPEIVDILFKLQYTSVGVDTKFARDYQPFLEKYKVDPKKYRVEEGEFSMYIDGVKSLAYKSSYELDNPIDMIDNTKTFGNIYKSSEQLFGEMQSANNIEEILD